MMGLGSIAAIAGLVIHPFTVAPDSIPAGKAWFAYDHQDPVLHLVRVEKVSVKSCKAWTQALVDGTKEKETALPSSAGATGDFSDSLKKAWAPWDEQDLDAVKGCDDFPCKVKLDRSEVKAMKKASEAQRPAVFRSLVSKRLENYEKTQVRKGYETPGIPIDPWKKIEELGFRPGLSMPEKPVLYARKLNLDPDRMLTIHQVIDQRAAVSTTGTEAVIWTRDAYTDHYFDSWGEWSSVNCDPSQNKAVVIQTLIAEMDLLKTHNIFARALFGRYRSAFEDNGHIYLNSQFGQVEKTARKLEKKTQSDKPASSPKASPSPSKSALR